MYYFLKLIKFKLFIIIINKYCKLFSQKRLNFTKKLYATIFITS